MIFRRTTSDFACKLGFVGVFGVKVNPKWDSNPNVILNPKLRGNPNYKVNPKLNLTIRYNLTPTGINPSSSIEYTS